MDPGSQPNEKPSSLLSEKDVLGLDKPTISKSFTTAHPARIFIFLGILVALALVYWLVEQGN